MITTSILPLSPASLEKFEKLWDKLPGKLSLENTEFLPTNSAVAILARSNLPKEWLKNIWEQARAGADRSAAGLTREQFVLSCVLVSVCKSHDENEDFPWSHVTEAVLSYGQLKNLNLTGLSDSNLAVPAAFTPRIESTQQILSATPALSVPPLPVRPQSEPCIQFPNAAVTPSVPTLPLVLPPSNDLPPIPPRRSNQPPQQSPAPVQQIASDNVTIPSAAQRPTPLQRIPSEMSETPPPSYDTVVGAAITTPSPIVSPAPVQQQPSQVIQQLASDEELARRLQAEEEEELTRALEAAHLEAAREEEVNRRAAEHLAEEDRRRAIELEDEELARRMQAEEESISRRTSSAAAFIPPVAPNTLFRPPAPISTSLPRPVSTYGGPVTPGPGGLSFNFFPATDLLLPASYGRAAFGVKHVESIPGIVSISQDVYLQFGPRDRDVREDRPLLWLHFFFNSPQLARRCRESWPRKSTVTPGVGLSVGGFRLPMPGLEVSTKGFEAVVNGRKCRQHVFVLKKAGEQLSRPMLAKLNLIVSDIMRDPSKPVSLAERAQAYPIPLPQPITLPRPSTSSSTGLSQPPIPLARSQSNPAPIPAWLALANAAEKSQSRSAASSPSRTSRSDDEESDYGSVFSGTECVVCLDAEKTHSLFPCGHRIACGDCAENIVKSTNPKCPVCRKQVIGSARVYV